MSLGLSKVIKSATLKKKTQKERKERKERNRLISLTLFFFFKNVLAILVLLPSPINFKLSFLYLQGIGIFTGIALNLPIWEEHRFRFPKSFNP